eukprot:3433058-Pyramimonas_sp.AAC.1
MGSSRRVVLQDVPLAGPVGAGRRADGGPAREGGEAEHGHVPGVDARHTQEEELHRHSRVLHSAGAAGAGRGVPQRGG